MQRDYFIQLLVYQILRGKQQLAWGTSSSQRLLDPWLQGHYNWCTIYQVLAYVDRLLQTLPFGLCFQTQVVRWLEDQSG